MTICRFDPSIAMPDLSIFQIESELAQLMDFRDNEGLSEAEAAAVDQQIVVYVQRELAKVDNIRGYLRHCAMMAEAATDEVKLQSKRAESWKARAEYLKGFCLDLMTSLDKKRLEGRSGYLLRKGNGGKQALTIYQESLVPEDMVLYRGWISAAAMEVIPEQIKGREDFQMEREVRSGFVRGELEKGTHVPGAKLEPRGEHIEVK